MKIFLFTISLFLTTLYLSGQNLVENYPQKFYSKADSVNIEFVQFSDYPKSTFKFYQKLKPKETVSPGTNGGPEIKTYIYIGKDTVVIPHKNFPYSQKINITIETPKGEATLAFRYNGLNSYFSQKYVDEVKGISQIELPEVYELANIIWYLSPAASKTGITGSTEYHRLVNEYFTPYKDHPIFKDEVFNKEKYEGGEYYDFRENSFAFRFNDEGKIIRSDRYFYVHGKAMAVFSAFGQLLSLVQDFSDKSNFREFYKENASFYKKRLTRLESLLPLSDMWKWLENEFPDNKIDSYKVVFSPLITGSHSTQRYVGICPPIKEDDADYPLFWEVIMFVCDAEHLDKNIKYSEEQKKGLMSGIVFTEIDHNYVNPESDKYSKRIIEIFGKPEIWSSDNQTYYQKPKSVFNEYMTHSLFCLWVLDYFDKETADIVIKERENMNQLRRGFIRFEDFNKALINLREKNKDKKVSELYPLILDWCSSIVKD